MDLTRDIISLTEFRRNSHHVNRLRDSSGSRALVLTVNGRADLVVLTAAEYQRLYDLSTRMEELLAIRQGLDDLNSDRVAAFENVFQRIREEHASSDSDHRDGTTGDR